jgi:Fuc2NAc and GlcNAc transferase
VAYGLCCCVVSAGLLHGAGLAAGLLLAALVFVATAALLWGLNLYNFMDGLDGFAASQCFLACCGVALLVGIGGNERYVYCCLLLAFSHLGFLIWNWPVARLFMGDAGSISTGFVVTALALLGAIEGILSLKCWLILLAIFITDASYTLCWRMFTGQQFTQAHRLHGYQRLSRHWGSHLPVLYLLIAINVLWLFPMAWAAKIWPPYSDLIVLLTYLPLLAGVVKLQRFG